VTGQNALQHYLDGFKPLIPPPRMRHTADFQLQTQIFGKGSRTRVEVEALAYDQTSKLA